MRLVQQLLVATTRVTMFVVWRTFACDQQIETEIPRVIFQILEQKTRIQADQTIDKRILNNIPPDTLFLFRFFF